MSDLITKVYNACEVGDVAEVKSFFKTSDFDSCTQLVRDNMLMRTIKSENLEILNLLLNQFIALAAYKNISNYESIGISSKYAATMGKLSVLNFLFDKFSHDKHLNEFLTNGSIMAPAIRNNHLDIVQYLMNKDSMKKHLNENPEILEKFFLVAYTKKQFNILHYFISDLNIKVTPYIERFIEVSPDVARLFHLKDLNKTLNKELFNSQQEPALSKRLKV